MDCPTIIVHARKCYKAHGYQLNDDSFKTPIQVTTTTLKTADGLPVTALGMTALHLRIARLNSHIISSF